MLVTVCAPLPTKKQLAFCTASYLLLLFQSYNATIGLPGHLSRPTIHCANRHAACPFLRRTSRADVQTNVSFSPMSNTVRVVDAIFILLGCYITGWTVVQALCLRDMSFLWEALWLSGFFPNRPGGHTPRPILTQNGSNDVGSRKDNNN